LGGSAGVDRLLGRPQARALGLERADDVLQITDRARQAINTRDHQHVALADEIEHRAELRAALGAGAALLLGADHVAAGRPLDETAADARRDEMARAAAPYLHARLASHTISGDPKNPLRTVRTIELVVTNKREDFVTVADSRRALLSPAGTGGEI